MADKGQGPGDYQPNPSQYQPQPPAYQQPGYATAPGYQQVPQYGGQQPPAYYGGTAQPPYPQSTSATNTNVVVVGQQPRPASTTVYRQYSGDYASGALIFAIFATFCVFFFGCWWSLICSIVAIVFAINANSAAASGDMAGARSNQNVSMVCSVISVVATVLGFIVLVIIIAVEVAAEKKDEDDYYDN